MSLTAVSTAHSALTCCCSMYPQIRSRNCSSFSRARCASKISASGWPSSACTRSCRRAKSSVPRRMADSRRRRQADVHGNAPLTGLFRRNAPRRCALRFVFGAAVFKPTRSQDLGMHRTAIPGPRPLEREVTNPYISPQVGVANEAAGVDPLRCGATSPLAGTHSSARRCRKCSGV